MSAAQMIPFAGWADTKWTVVATRSRTEHGAIWHAVDGAPPLHAVMDDAYAGRCLVAQRHEDGVSHLVWRAAGRRS